MLLLHHHGEIKQVFFYHNSRCNREHCETPTTSKLNQIKNSIAMTTFLYLRKKYTTPTIYQEELVASNQYIS